jgi:uncharacterized protein (TIGR02186 family)
MAARVSIAARLKKALCVAAFAILAAGSPAAGATSGLVEGGAAQNHFFIEPSYDGTSLALFGSVDTARLNGAPFDVAVTIRGPFKPVTVWKKARRGVFWINAERVTFEGVPDYYAALSTRPVTDLAPPEERRKHEIGIDALSLPALEGRGERSAQAPQEFRDALIKLKKASGLFVEDSQGAIDFFGARLFRTRAFLPPAASPGLYRAEFYILQNGKVVGEASSRIRLRKIGIEARLSSAAIDHPWLYGLAAVVLAAAVGGGASVVFRRS